MGRAWKKKKNLPQSHFLHRMHLRCLGGGREQLLAAEASPGHEPVPRDCLGGNPEVWGGKVAAGGLGMH